MSADSIMASSPVCLHLAWGTEHGQNISENDVVQPEMRTGCTNRMTM